MGVRVDTREVEQALAKFHEKLQVELEVAVDNTCNFIESAAKQMAPVLTGYLRDNIRKGVIKTVKAVISGEVKSDAEYSIWVEGGTAYRSAQPYLRPVLKRAESVLRNEIAEAFQRAWS